MTPTPPPAAAPASVEVVRNGFVESRHQVSVVAVGADGRRVLAYGDADAPVFPRSAVKPLQAVGMLRAGLALDGELLALAASSHNGEPHHVGLVREILAGVGLDESALATTPDLPLHVPSAHALLRAGGGPDPVHHNCSGKHAAMLATCVARGWPIRGYLDPDHPLQRALADTVAELAGVPLGDPAVDGCGAPLWAMPLAALAAATGRLVTAAPGSPQRRVADAMRAFPHTVGGTDRDVTGVMAAVPGLLAKDGAEGVYAAALPDGTGVALKVHDGSARARTPVLVAALRALGVEVPELNRWATVPVLGHGAPVGEVRATPLAASPRLGSAAGG